MSYRDIDSAQRSPGGLSRLYGGSSRGATATASLHSRPCRAIHVLGTHIVCAFYYCPVHSFMGQTAWRGAP
ncbi:hypothetical protein J6590_011036 [Homalodisca vitripennis]|nr:hypothetical protein J6590_011036 [Homalodisca vitripennis]